LVLRAVFGIVDGTYEIVVVDDGSSDDTAKAALTFPCRLIRHPKNRGKGAALRTGLQQARASKVIFLDADNTYPVEAIPSLSKLLDKNDLVRGVRTLNRKNIPLINRLGNILFDSTIHLANMVEGGDMLSGMYGGRRDKLLTLDLESEGFDIEAEICVKAKAQGLHCVELPITYAQRVGEKKLNAFHDGFRILYRIMQLSVSYSPMFTFILPGIAFLLFGLIGFGLMRLNQLHIVNLPLAMNSLFLIGAVESLGTQLLIFGTAVYEAGMAYGLRGQANKSLEKISKLLSTRASMLIGSLIGVASLVGVALLSIYWLIRPGPFLWTALLVFLSFWMLIGFQVASAGIFLSALKGLNRVTIETSKIEEKETEVRNPQLVGLKG
jgi:glycosyltransferase involved in cell wall biosynthesis